MNKKLFGAVAAFWIFVIPFCYIAGEVLERQPLHPDAIILRYIHSQASPFLDTLFLVVTTIGNAEIITPLALLICGLLLRSRARWQAGLVFVSFFGAATANFLLKLLFHRQRPAFWQSAVHETGYSFPSGHAMMSSALVFSLIIIAWPTKYRWPVLIFGLLFMLAIGLSRLYLGVHYPTDIIAGWLASAAWVTVVTAALFNAPQLIRK